MTYMSGIYVPVITCILFGAVQKEVLISETTFARSLTNSCLRGCFLGSHRLTFMQYHILMMPFPVFNLRPSYIIQHPQLSSCFIHILRQTLDN